jgi:hypothetical protein
MVDFSQQVTVPLSDEFPPLDVPTIFVDGIMNLANSRQIAKFYLRLVLIWRKAPGS